MTKRGQRVKSWKERYFVLEEGRLSYFRIKTSDSTGMYEWTKLGEVYLAGYIVKRENVTGVTVSHDHEIRGPGECFFMSFFLDVSGFAPLGNNTELLKIVSLLI